MLKDYLDRDVYNAITKSFNFNDITEVRMRCNENMVIVIKNKKYFLKADNGKFIKTSTYDIENFVKRISGNSLYAFNDNILNGYITLPHGIRVGLCGTVVADGNKLVTMKNFQSVNIRIPHFIKNCSVPALDFLLSNDTIQNTLIISPPGSGKTTFIRDFIYQLNKRNISKNILVADERNEICSVVEGVPDISLGGFCDIITNSTKAYAFTNAIRSMRPEIIVTDELDLEKDIEPLLQAINSGVNIIATIHAKDINQLKRKPSFDSILNEKYFSRFVVLSSDNGPGTLNYIYDEKLNCIYCR